MNPTIYSIRNLNALLKATLEKEMQAKPVSLEGKIHKTPNLSERGHLYFTLEDKGYTIDCMLREEQRATIGFTLQKGMEVEIYGTAIIFEKTALLQIEVEQVHLLDRPNNAEFANAITNLKNKGLWPKQKLSIPSQIKKIGLITSKHSDAIHDFENTYREEAKNNAAAVQVIDVRVAGQYAPQEISDAIYRLNREQTVDVIVLTRGGGRASELAIFNDTLIVEAICRSTIPVVTGIGHDRDETLADQAADKATRTPTAAAYFLATGQVFSERTDLPTEETDFINSQSPPIGNTWMPYVVGVMAVAIVILLLLLVLQ